MTTPNPQPDRLRVAHLNPRAPTPFSLTPDAHRCAAIAADAAASMAGAQLAPELVPRLSVGSVPGNSRGITDLIEWQSHSTA